MRVPSQHVINSVLPIKFLYHAHTSLNRKWGCRYSEGGGNKGGCRSKAALFLTLRMSAFSLPLSIAIHKAFKPTISHLIISITHFTVTGILSTQDVTSELPPVLYLGRQPYQDYTDSCGSSSCLEHSQHYPDIVHHHRPPQNPK